MRFENLLKHFGFSDKSTLGVDEVNPRSKLNEFLKHPSFLSEYMIYESYNTETELFSLKDNFKGFFIELNPKVGINENFERNLEYFLSDEMPANAYLQFTLIASHEVSKVIDEWNGIRKFDSKILTKIAKNRKDFLREKASSFDQDSVLPRNYRLIISVSEQNPIISSMISFKKKIASKFKSLEMLPNILSAQDLINVTSSIATMDLANEDNLYDERTLLKNQVLRSGKVEVKEDSILYNEQLATRMYNVEVYPKEFSLNQMINLLGESSSNSSIVPARFIISFGVTRVSESNRANLIARGVSIIKSVESGHGRMTNISDEAREWIDIVRNSSDVKFLETSFLVTLTTLEDKLSDASIAIKSLFGNHGFKLSSLRYINLLGLLSILPMNLGYYFSEMQKFKLTSFKITSEAVAILPIHGEWKGVPEPCVLFLARRGQLFHFNPFYRISSGNYNIALFGPSGSGKSVFLQEMVTCMVASNVKVFALDIGQSYKNLCTLLDGEMIKFSRDMNISLNPFSSLKNCKTQEERDDILAVARSIIYSMTGADTKLLMSIIDKALAELVKSDSEINMTTIAEAIKKDNSKEASDLSKTMFSYTKDGVYGKYFDKESNVYFDKPLTVFEFEEIKSDVGLLSVVLQVISMQVFMQVLTGDRKSRFMLIVDEAWMILDYCAKFLGDLARTIRKYGGSLVTCVQNYSDFQSNEERRNILANSTWTIIMQQKKDGIDAMSKYSVFDEILPLIKSVSFKPGKYSELLIMADSVSVVGRLVLDKYSATLYSTDSHDFAYLIDKVNAGYSLDEATELLVEMKS